MLYGMGLWSPEVHTVVTAVHVFSAVFWLGWMVFIFAVLRPVLRRVAPSRAGSIQQEIRHQVRRLVFWLIPVILLTGVHNMAYVGLLDLDVLFETGRGHSMLAKLGAVTLLFGIYYAAPTILSGPSNNAAYESVECHGDSDPMVRRASMMLHAVAFGSGATAAVLGISLGG